MTEKYTVQIITPKGVTLGSFHLSSCLTQHVLGSIRNEHKKIEDRINWLTKPPSTQDIEFSKEGGKVAKKAEELSRLIDKEWERN